MNSVAHTDTIFNDSLDTKPRRKGGRPRKQPITQLIDGFPTCISQSAYFNVPAVFMDIIAAIDNLAELKVVMYILRHTWGFREFNAPLRLTTDELMHGRFKRDGSRMDNGTGLCKRAVQQGLQRAIDHGFLACYVDERDMARVKHFYQLSMQNEETASPEPEEDFTATCDGNLEEQSIEVSTDQLVPDYVEQETEDYDPYAGTIFAKSPKQKIFVSEPCTTIPPEVHNIPPRGANHSHRTQQRTNIINSLTKDIRNVHPSENLEEAIRFLPEVDQLPKAKAKSPAFIRNMLTDFSRDLGDQDHIFSNISQASRLYRDCGLTEEAFMQALYDARALAKKATKVRHLNNHGNPNRMPYFFRCLGGALRPSTAECHS